MKALIIEDNQQIVKDIAFCLQVRYSDVDIISVDKGLGGVKLIETEPLDLVLIDSSLPDIDTTDLVRKIREFCDVPLIILSESETDVDRARWLEAGADEYITKPFSPIELLAKVKALLRRTQGLGFKPEHIVNYSCGLSINFTTREVFLSGNRVKLTPTEYRLLSELVRNEGKVLTHSRLIERVWGPEYSGDYSFVKRYIYRLRQKLNDDSNNPRIIQNEHGVGYKLIKST